MTTAAEQSMAHPLHWPTGQRRNNYRTRWKGKGVTVSAATAQLAREVRLLGAAASTLVVSSNLALRLDGFPRSGQAEPADPGVAVYFNRKGKRLVFACDKYRTVGENIRAVAAHLEALRGMERWGVGTADQAFAGYAALPPPSDGPAWWSDLGLPSAPSTMDELRAAYYAAAKRAHPDTGGSAAQWQAVDRAFRSGLAAMGTTNSASRQGEAVPT